MILAPILNGIMAGVHRRKAEQEQNKANAQLDANESFLDNTFNSQYYKDFTDRADVSNLLRTAREEQKKLSSQSRKAIAVTGGTEEAAADMQDRAASRLSDAYGNIAAIGAQWKDSLYKDYINRKSAIGDRRYGIYQNAANMFNGNSNNYLSGVIDGIGNIDNSMLGLATGKISGKLSARKKEGGLI